MPFGPEISWPYGFRQMDPEARELLESAYRTGSSYGQPASDDFGYGDPGYSDPSYEPSLDYSTGARSAPMRPSGSGPSGSGSRRPRDPQVSGYHSPSFAPTANRPDTGRQRPAYPEQWYDNPRLSDRAKLPAAPRLEGMNYDELRYDDQAPGLDDQPLDAESWYAELRRGGPAYPPDPGTGQSGNGRSGPGPSRSGQPGPARSGPARSGPARSGSGQGGYRQPGNGPRPAPGNPGSGRRGSSRSNPGYGRSGSGWPGYGHPSGPQASVSARPGSGSQSGQGAQAGRGAQASRGAQGSFGTLQGSATRMSPAEGLLSAPVGLLTPPSGTPVQAPAEALDAAATVATPILGTERGTAVRPGHGLDGPEITSSWPAAPQVGDAEDYEDFWREDDDDEYKGLFGDREEEQDKPAKVKRAIGRRRGRSNDHRLWFALGGVVVVAAAAITGIIKFEFPSHGGPAHTLVTPATIGTYIRTQNLEKQTNVAELRDEVIKMSSGQASNVVDAVYESGNSAAGNDEQIIMFIGGHLARADAASSVASFDQRFPGAKPVSAGALGGAASCVQEGTSGNSVAMCAWFDNDSFGELSSPTMSTQALSAEMRAMRPSLEHVTNQ